MEIIFVTGKGGVGRSAVAAAIAMNRAEAGKRTILAELGEQSFYRDYFNLPEVRYQPLMLKPNLDLALWSGAECLKEYALYLLKVPGLYRLFFENPVSRALINVAPALPELSILGKITSSTRHVGPKMPYDCIVIDAFASGNFVALLQAPRGLAQTVRIGPMAEQCRDIDKILCDGAICSYYVVSLPEELPVIEGLELAQSIKQITGQGAQHILNRVVEIPPAALEARPQQPELVRFAEHLRKISTRQRQMIERLKSAIVLPAVFDVHAWSVVNQIAPHLKVSPHA